MGIHLLILVGITGIYVLAKCEREEHRLQKKGYFFLTCGEWIHKRVFRSHRALTPWILSVSLAVLFYGNLAGAIFTYIEIQESKREIKTLERPDSGSYTENLEVKIGNNERKKLNVEVPERKYNKDEKEKYIKIAKEKLEQYILGDNISYEKVTYPMKLPETLPGLPVQIRWTSSDPVVIDWEGNPGAQIDLKGEKVVLQAEISVGDQTEIKNYQVTVFPPEETEESRWNYILQKEISRKNEEKTGELYELPDIVNGNPVYWYHTQKRTGIMILFLGAVTALALILRQFQENNQQKQKREVQMLLDYPGLVSKILLFLGAGLSMRKTLQRIAERYQKKRKEGGENEKHIAYEELVKTVREIECGVPEKTAYENFGERCGCDPYRVMCILLVRNLQKGSRGLMTLLEKEARDSFENRKRQAKIAGDKASTRLLFPMGMMLLVVLIILMVPAFMSFM